MHGAARIFKGLAAVLLPDSETASHYVAFLRSGPPNLRSIELLGIPFFTPVFPAYSGPGLVGVQTTAIHGRIALQIKAIYDHQYVMAFKVR